MNKLLEFQKKVGVIIKDSTNPFFKSKYADINSLLETIKPVLSEVGLVVMQPLTVCDSKNVLTTEIWDDEKIIAKSAIFLPDNLDPQKIGSAITYYRRYSLQALLALEAEDDDGNLTKPNGHKPELKPLIKERNFTDEANNCNTIDELKIWYKKLTPVEQTTMKALVTNRKQELSAVKDIPIENTKPDILMQTIDTLNKKNFDKQIKLVEQLIEDHKGLKLPYCEAAMAKIKDLGIEYDLVALPF